MKKLISALIILSVLSGNLFAEDLKSRQGMNFEFRVGFAPLVHFDRNLSSFPTINSDEVKTGYLGGSAAIFIGYGLDDRNVIGLMRETAIYKGERIQYFIGYYPDYYSYSQISSYYQMQSFTGLVFRHYQNVSSPSLYFEVGTGMFDMFYLEGDFNNPDPGFSGHFGIGYEMSKHRTFSMTYSFGATNPSNRDYTHSQLILSFGLLFY